MASASGSSAPGHAAGPPRERPPAPLPGWSRCRSLSRLVGARPVIAEADAPQGTALTDARIGVQTAATSHSPWAEKQGVVSAHSDDVRQGVVPCRVVATRTHLPDAMPGGGPTLLPLPVQCGFGWTIWTVVLLSSFAGFRLRARTSWRTPSDLGKFVSASRPVEGRIQASDGLLRVRCLSRGRAVHVRLRYGWGPVAVQRMPCVGLVAVLWMSSDRPGGALWKAVCGPSGTSRRAVRRGA
jgi:hypothetical protein